MNFNLLALGIAALGSISLGIAVYQRTPDRVWNRLFAIHATLTGLWTFCNFMIMAAETATDAAIYLRLSHPLAALAICTVVDFAWVFPERIEYADRNRRLPLYALGLALGTIGFAPGLIESIEIGPGIVNVNYGWPLIPFALFVVGALAYTDIVLLRKAIRLEGMQRVQVIWVLIGLAGAHIVATVTIIAIPIIWETTALSGWGAAGIIIQLMGMGYAIAKHRLMQPEVALRRVASTGAAVVIVLILGISGLHLVEPLLLDNGVPLEPAYVGVGLLMGMLIVLVHGKVTKYVRRTGSTGADPAAVQAETSSRILRTLDSEHLLSLLAHALDDALQPAGVVVYTRSRTGRHLVPQVIVHDAREVPPNGQPPIDMGHVVLDLIKDGSLLTRDQVFRFASLNEARRLSTAMDELEAHMIAPLIWEDELIGVVTLGSKRTGEMYAEDELRFVADVALQASLAMRNADLYAETATLKDFNERILSQMDNAVVVTDDQEEIVVFNSAAEQLFEIPARAALASSVDVLPDPIANCIRASLGSGRILSSRHFEIQRGDRLVPLACSTSPLETDGEVRPQGAVAVISDLTLIQELDRERAEAERLSLIRVISAGMAHEIRNPLVAIRTFAELAPRRLDDPEFRSNFLTVVREEIMRIDKLVGDLLTLSKPADAVVEDLDIDMICRGVVRAMAGVAEAREVDLTLELDELAGVGRGDETRLHQALLNLVSNAIDAEPEGGSVTVTTYQCGDEETGDAVCIRVHNPSSFIPEEQTDEIFRPFVSKKAKGTGLGLAICQTIIEEHRGDVRIESTRADGTAFVVELPLTRVRTVVPTGES